MSGAKATKNRKFYDVGTRLKNLDSDLEMIPYGLVGLKLNLINLEKRMKH
jgi:hypothetical protein